ncbi:MAG TPA: ATP-binding protein [Longimicrobiaceae bacterium]|nr:ATP-binding protein [Longimicrobiaceae bacterium]
MLRTVYLRFGPGEGEPPLVFNPGPMTVFVGPNNSGKSLMLREIEDFLETGGTSERRMVDRLVPDLPDAAQAARMVAARSVDDPNSPLAPGWVRVSRLRSLGEQARKRATDLFEPPSDQMVNLPAVLRALEVPHTLSTAEFSLVCRDFLALFTIRLDGQTRLALTQPRLTGDLHGRAANHLAALFRDDAAREKIREITADALGRYFVIDSTSSTHLRVRMSDRAPHDAQEEPALDARARTFHARAHDIAEMSDGVKAFTGLTAAVLSADYRIMLVDEPEAFLHPPLTRKLGKRLTQLATERGANVMAATHSPEFVMGCIQSGKRVNIVRITWRERVPSARLLSADKLQTLMRDPLLRSTGVLNALFHDGAIVCEADADRVFYQEINERLLAARAGGADGSVFLNAQNKQTIRRIVRPLRQMGIPAAAVVDLDILKGREDFRDLLKAAFVPSIFWEPWEETRARIQQKLRNEEFKAGGIHALPRDVRPAGETLLSALCDYGIFLVPRGELESWLPELEVGGHGPEWLTQVFDRMGADPADPDYQYPSEGGVWRFMQSVASWIADPRRKGMGEDRVPVDHLLAPPRPAEPAAADAAAMEGAEPDGDAMETVPAGGGPDAIPRPADIPAPPPAAEELPPLDPATAA